MLHLDPTAYRGARSRVRAASRIARSDAVAVEIREVLSRPKFARVLTQARQGEIADLIFSDSQWFDPRIRVSDCRDPSDDKYLELALASGAAVIVSSDKDLLDLDPWRGVRIVRPAEFLTLPVE